MFIILPCCFLTGIEFATGSSFLFFLFFRKWKCWDTFSLKPYVRCHGPLCYGSELLHRGQLGMKNERPLCMGTLRNRLLSMSLGYESKLYHQGDRRFQSFFPLTSVSFCLPLFDPQKTWVPKAPTRPSDLIFVLFFQERTHPKWIVFRFPCATITIKTAPRASARARRFRLRRGGGRGGRGAAGEAAGAVAPGASAEARPCAAPCPRPPAAAQQRRPL